MPIDYSDYPKNWKTEIVPAVLDRAGHCCEFCGLENGQSVWSVKIFVRRYGKAGDIISPWGNSQIWFRDERDALKVLDYIAREIKEVKVVLTVAHLDHNPQDDVPLDRLRALCQQCHLRYDAEEKHKRMNNGQQELF